MGHEHTGPAGAPTLYLRGQNRASAGFKPTLSILLIYVFDGFGTTAVIALHEIHADLLERVQRSFVLHRMLAIANRQQLNLETWWFNFIRI